MQNYENFSKKINTLFVGKDLRYLPSCQSTNLYALDLIQNDDYFDGTVVITDCQTAGRGQQGNTWDTEPFQNITTSIILKPQFLSLQEQFELNIAITLGIYDLLEVFVPNPDLLKIKWSNDLLYDRKKLCGILIQNVVSGNTLGKSVIGIGLNINQKTFLYPQATSLSLVTGMDYELSVLTEKLFISIERKYLQLKQGKTEILRQEYYKRLYGFGEEKWFSKEGESFMGKIVGVDNLGRLQIDVLGDLKVYQFKEIQFLLDKV
ncbi:MAG: biotin--[acetyl-CoA-carboxylase] ligase [Raineya sp.]|jgi:BirA family biotin operon repressor/biotin-[acetyl-CoA-carboxylase] ligase|nr:biotin--[acetyl-CoA-carboxylase] ligase [Raineya sp.]